MRLLYYFVPLVCAFSLCAQSGEDPEIEQAKAQVAKIRALVEAGALPRQQLEKAEAGIVDAEDAAFLSHTLYGEISSTSISGEMVATAQRRLNRRQQALDAASKQAEAGVRSRTSLADLEADVKAATEECQLAAKRAQEVSDIAQMAETEEYYEARWAHSPSETRPVAERFDGSGVFNSSVIARIEVEYSAHFGKSLPISANGETAVHRALGFDHRGRVDVAVRPDQPEGVWLRDYLLRHGIPFFAFRQAIPGKATGAHIHIGPSSTRIANGG